MNAPFPAPVSPVQRLATGAGLGDGVLVLVPNSEMEGQSAAFWTAREGWQVAADRGSGDVLVRLPTALDGQASRIVLAAASAQLWLASDGGWIGSGVVEAPAGHPESRRR